MIVVVKNAVILVIVVVMIVLKIANAMSVVVIALTQFKLIVFKVGNVVLAWLVAQLVIY